MEKNTVGSRLAKFQKLTRLGIIRVTGLIGLCFRSGWPYLNRALLHMGGANGFTNDCDIYVMHTLCVKIIGIFHAHITKKLP